MWQECNLYVCWEVIFSTNFNCYLFIVFGPYMWDNKEKKKTTKKNNCKFGVDRSILFEQTVNKILQTIDSVLMRFIWHSNKQIAKILTFKNQQPCIQSHQFTCSVLPCNVCDFCLTCHSRDCWPHSPLGKADPHAPRWPGSEQWEPFHSKMMMLWLNLLMA